MKKILICLITALFAFTAALGASAQGRTVKVAFFPSGRFNIYDGAGEMTGYNVEYLKNVAEKTGWNIKYVKCKNWNEAQEIFFNGKADILAPVQRTPEREKAAAFCILPSGSTYGGLITLSGNDDIVYEDFKKFGEIKIGCLKEYVFKKEFFDYAARNGFTPHVVYFDTPPAMYGALAAKEIDAVAANLTAMTERHKMLGKFAPAPFYYVTGNENKELLRELNDAVASLKINDPDLEKRLNSQFYAFQQVRPYSRSDLDFTASADVLRTALPTSRPPLSYLDSNGDFTGIIPDLMRIVSQKSGLRFSFIPIIDGERATSMVTDGKADLLAPVFKYSSSDSWKRLPATEPLFPSTTVFAAKTGLDFSPALRLKIAVPYAIFALQKYIKNKYPNFVLKTYNTPAECMEAVKKGEADATLGSAYVISALLQGPRYDGIEAIASTSTPVFLAIGSAPNTPPQLISIIDKTIKNTSSTVIDAVINKHTISKPYKITNNINGGVITLRGRGSFIITYANDGFLNLIGFSREEFDKNGPTKCIAYIHPEDSAEFAARFCGEQQEGACVSMEVRILNVNSGYIYTLFRGTAARNTAGHTVLYCVMLDITEEKKMRARLQSEMERYALVVEQSNDIIFDINAEDKRALFSNRYKQIFGAEKAENYPGDNFSDTFTIYGDDMPVYNKIMAKVRAEGGSSVGKIRLRTQDGSFAWYEVHIHAVMKKNEISRFVGKITDVSSEVREYERLRMLSQHDQLTGLYNKTAFRAAAEALLEHSRRGSLVFLDLDDFKRLNDTLGHIVGDEVLVETAQKLRGLFRKDEAIGRFGGDEFCIFMNGAGPSEAERRCEAVLRALRVKTIKDGLAVGTSASIGIACFNGRADYDSLLSQADSALYTAKAGGRDRFAFYSEESKGSRL